MMKDKCGAKVPDSTGFHSFPCSRNAVVDGFCRQHDPVAAAKRREAQHARWDAEEAVRDWNRARVRLAEEAYAVLANAQPSSLDAIGQVLVDLSDRIRDHERSKPVGA